jgi:hypothetical protein
MKKALPGPYTFIFEASAQVPKVLHSNKKTVGIRVPNHGVPRALVEELGHPILSSSLREEEGFLDYSTDPELIFEKYQHLVDIVIDTRSVDTGFASFNEHIQAEDFLDTAKYPTATFKSTNVVFEGDKPKTIEGDLTIKGVTKPVTLKVNHFTTMTHPMLKKDAIGANASTVIKRSEFNAGKYAPNVGDEVTITIAIEAIKG